VEAKRFLQTIGAEVSNDFVKNRSILSFEEYLGLFLQSPVQQSRNAAQYLRDAMDHFGTEQVPHPTGKIRRFKLFDLTDDGGSRVAGQEEVQNAIYRVIGNFTRAGRINKVILLHGPNGSAKSTLIHALKRAMEQYSKLPNGALYRMNWVFPSEKLIKGSIGFADIIPTDTHTASVVAQGTGYVGALTLGAVSESNITGIVKGSVPWSFSVPDNALDFLSAGQVLTQSYNVTIADGHGGTLVTDPQAPNTNQALLTHPQA